MYSIFLWGKNHVKIKNMIQCDRGPLKFIFITNQFEDICRLNLEKKMNAEK